MLPDWFTGNPWAIPALKSAVVIAIYFVANLLARRITIRLGNGRGHDADRIRGTLHVVRTLLQVLFAIVLLLVLGLDPKEIPAYLGSFLAVVGVACFASWSILSNVTAGLILFSARDLTVGDRIRIIDEKEPVEGRITAFMLWSLVLRRDDGCLIHYPNSLVLQRPLVILARDHDGRTTQLLGPIPRSGGEHG